MLPISRSGDRDVGIRTADNSHVRLAARHPNHKLICAVSIRQSECCVNVIPVLFPEMCQAHVWTCGDDKGGDAALRTLDDLLSQHVDVIMVAWDTKAPYRCTKVKIMDSKHEAGSSLFLET